MATPITAKSDRYGFKVVDAAKGREAEIWIYEEIGVGWFGGLSASQFVKDIKEIGSVDRILLHINSPGGEVSDGVAIYNVLRQHKARKIVHVDALAASIASVIAMAGDEIHMADNALMMIHNAWGLSMGYAEDMRKTADILDKFDGTIVATYQKRTKLDESKIKELMASETWMNAQEAVDYGFADDVTDALEIAAHFDLSKFKYRNIPERMVPPAGDLRVKLARMSLAARRIASSPRKQ